MHIRWMRANVLARYDPEVDTHLTRLNIPLSVIGIRWYRLLFGREVSFGDLLTLWDAIFANHFQLVKYFPAAMLISVREKCENGLMFQVKLKSKCLFYFPFQCSLLTLLVPTSV